MDKKFTDFGNAEAWREPQSGVIGAIDSFQTEAKDRAAIIDDFIELVVMPERNKIARRMEEELNKGNTKAFCAIELDGMRFIANLYDQFFKRLDDNQKAFKVARDPKFCVKACMKYFEKDRICVGYEVHDRDKRVILYMSRYKSNLVSGERFEGTFRGYSVYFKWIQT